MPHTPDPYTSFLVGLRDAYSAGGASSSAFRAGAQGISPFGGRAGVDSDSAGIAGIAGGAVGGGAGGGTVPGTAITGPNLLEGILAGGGPSGGLQQSVGGLGFGFGGGGGESEPGGLVSGELDNLQGGDLRMLSTLLNFGPLAIPLILGQLVFDDATAGPAGFGADATGGDPFTFGGTSGLDLGGNTAGVNFGSDPLTNPSGGVNFGGGGGGGGGGLSFGGGGGGGGSDGSLSFSGGGGSSGINTSNDDLTNPAGGVQF